MNKKNILITGGAGFVGSNLAISFKTKYPDAEIVALDNLKRRGSELNIRRLRDFGIQFVHGDIRNKEDLNFEDHKFDLLMECSAEPSVLAGYTSSPEYLLNSNLVGVLNCLEVCRKHRADLVFLSTSRVYPHRSINSMQFREEETRFTLLDDQELPGASQKGISEDFPLQGVRSLYGATKLAAELIIMEYAAMYEIRTVVNRCGVIAGPYQMGKVDQGVFSLWVAAHYYKKPLAYIGFGGLGKQVRDVLHISDLFELLDHQVSHIGDFNSRVYNVGGGLENSLSLLEMTRVCEEIIGNKISMRSVPEDRPADIKSYISDNSRILKDADWTPQRNPKNVLEDIYNWINENSKELEHILS